MPFWHYRTLHNLPDLKVFEGVYSTASSRTPDILLAVTTLLFQHLDNSPLFILTSLPVLMRQCRTQSQPSWDWQSLFITAGAINMPSIATSIFTNWDLFTDKGLVAFSQILFTTLLTAMMMGTIFLHWRLQDIDRLKLEGWAAALSFGIMWAMTMIFCEWVSPLGRHGLPVPTIASDSHWSAILRYCGTSGLNVYFGSLAYMMYEPPTMLRELMERLNDTPASSASSRIVPISDDGESAGTLTGSVPNLNTAYAPTYSPGSTWTAGSTRSPPKKKKWKQAAALICGIEALLIGSTQVETPSLSASLETQTPFEIGLVLPRPRGMRETIDTLIHEGQTIGNRANLLVYPENAFIARTAYERFDGIERIQYNLCKQYGIHVLMGIDSLDGAWSDIDGVMVKVNGHVNEMVLIGPDGMMGSYLKQNLVPFVESHSLTRGQFKIPTWDIYLPVPPGINRTDWTPSSPHRRVVRISPVICFEAFHPALLNKLDPRPDLLIISASSPSIRIGRQLLSRAEDIAITLWTPTLLVASGRQGRSDGSGISALLDGCGRHLHYQRGGKSTVLQVALPHGKTRHTRWQSWMGTAGVLSAGVLLLVGHSAHEWWTSRGDDDGRGGIALRTSHRARLRLFRMTESLAVIDGGDDDAESLGETAPLQSADGWQLSAGDHFEVYGSV